VAERANDEILQLAGQGNLQALSVYLNRHLIPSGAHVKVKQKDEALHVLIVVMSESEHAGLIKSVQDLLIKLHPTHIKRVKVYTQVLGQKQASLRQQFAISPTGAPQSVNEPPYSGMSNGVQSQVSASKTAVSNASALPSGTKKTGSRGANDAQLSSSLPSQSAPTPKARRHSVADFLAQARNVEDLRVLTTHPFFTGICPHCGHSFPQLSSPPMYWDCSDCGWQDDLNSVMPPEASSQDSSQISLTESKRLGDYLLEAGLLTDAQIEVALADQMTTNLRFGDILIRRGWVKEETIEYLMQKVILPERTGLQSASSYLESSRNLLKTLFKARTSSQAPNSLLLGPPTMALDHSSVAQESRQENSSVSHRSIDPPVVPKVSPSVAPKAKPFSSGKLANERETLILPDVELDELDNYLNGSQRKNKS
jgi:hypothetical protein